MVVVAVKRLGDEDQNGDKRHCVSLLSLQTSYAIEHFNLPFCKYSPVDSMSCRGLLYFNDKDCLSVICNLRTRQIKLLPPPDVPSPTSVPMANGCGLGYDATTHDYKVFRSFSVRTELLGRPRFKSYAQLYSLNNESWKNIPSPDAYIFPGNAVYVDETGCCYWHAALGESFGVLLLSSLERYDVLSFNFATEKFGHFPLPPICNDEYTYFLIKCGDSLGAVTYMKPPDITYYPRDVSALIAAQVPTFTIIKRVGENWINFRKIVVSFEIWKPLSMTGYRYLFVEVKHSGMRCQLALYDLKTAKLKRFSVYGQHNQMDVFPSSGSNQEVEEVLCLWSSLYLKARKRKRTSRPRSAKFKELEIGEREQLRSTAEPVERGRSQGDGGGNGETGECDEGEGSEEGGCIAAFG